MGIPISSSKNCKIPDWCIFQDYQQYHGLCSPISSFPNATKMDHQHQSSFIYSPPWVVLRFGAFFLMIGGLRKGEQIYRLIPNPQANFALNCSHWQLHLQDFRCQCTEESCVLSLLIFHHPPSYPDRSTDPVPRYKNLKSSKIKELGGEGLAKHKLPLCWCSAGKQ